MKYDLEDETNGGKSILRSQWHSNAHNTLNNNATQYCRDLEPRVEITLKSILVTRLTFNAYVLKGTIPNQHAYPLPPLPSKGVTVSGRPKAHNGMTNYEDLIQNFIK